MYRYNTEFGHTVIDFVAITRQVNERYHNDCVLKGLVYLSDREQSKFLMMHLFETIQHTYESGLDSRSTVFYYQKGNVIGHTLGAEDRWKDLQKIAKVFPVLSCRHTANFIDFADPMGDGQKTELNNIINDVCDRFDSSAYSLRKQKAFAQKHHINPSSGLFSGFGYIFGKLREEEAQRALALS